MGFCPVGFCPDTIQTTVTLSGLVAGQRPAGGVSGGASGGGGGGRGC